jgi:hypothetical protein
MKRALLVFALGSCAFAQKHPAVTVGITAGSIGFFMCEINVEKIGTCGAIGAGIGVVLGGITGLVTLLAETNAEEPAQGESGAIDTQADEPPGLPPGMLLDAGVPLPTTAIDAAVPVADAAPADAP